MEEVDTAEVRQTLMITGDPDISRRISLPAIPNRRLGIAGTLQQSPRACQQGLRWSIERVERAEFESYASSRGRPILVSAWLRARFLRVPLCPGSVPLILFPFSSTGETGRSFFKDCL